MCPLIVRREMNVLAGQEMPRPSAGLQLLILMLLPFFTKWLKDVALDQKPGGEVPDVIPDVLNKQDAKTAAPSAGWGDVAVIVPWNMYQYTATRNCWKHSIPA